MNNGTHGMAASVRWTVSPDRCAILVVEDPVSVEADPLPNGFLLASERGLLVLQRDSVWDVAPSPDWTRLAYGRAYTLPAGERDSVTDAEWNALGERAHMAAWRVRGAVFSVSGMTTAYGLSRPVVADLSPDLPGGVRERVMPGVGGWRVRWSADGSIVAVAVIPARTADDAPGAVWNRLDAKTGDATTPITGPPTDTSSADSVARRDWIAGPTIDISVPVDLRAPRSIAAGERTIESRDGWIRLTDRAPDGRASQRIVGPGMALAATAGARFIVALAPRVEKAAYEPSVQLVVYQIRE